MPVRNLFEIKELFIQLALEDESAFKTIFELYRKKIFATALKMIKDPTASEEIVQEVFLSIWVARARLGDVKDPEAYLFTMTYNAIYNQLKKASRDRKFFSAILLRLTDIQNTTEETIAANESEKLINQAIQELPAQQKMVYSLSKQEGLSYEEIADKLNISRNTVRNHLAEAMKTIRHFLKRTGMLLLTATWFLIK